MTDYFELPEVSNSDLGQLRKEIYGVVEIPNLDYHYAFGSLVDAMLTEPEHIIKEARAAYNFTSDQLAMSEKMVAYCLKDPLIPLMLKKSIGQYVYIRTISFKDGLGTFKMKCRCKFDLLNKPMKMGLDFKTLSVDSYKSFIASIEHFDYDRQGAFYMEIAKIDRFWIVGISKKTAEVFKLAIVRGDKYHLSGVGKFTYWARKYYEMIYNLDI